MLLTFLEKEADKSKEDKKTRRQEEIYSKITFLI